MLNSNIHELVVNISNTTIYLCGLQIIDRDGQ